MSYMAAKPGAPTAAGTEHTGVQDWPHGLGAYKLGLVMGQHVEIIAI